MKKTTLILLIFGCIISNYAQTSDFNDGTTQGWTHIVGLSNPPVNPGNFLEQVSEIGTGLEDQILISNSTSSWTGVFGGNFLLFDARNPSNSDLLLRVSFRGTDGTLISTIDSRLVLANSDWETYGFLLESTDDLVVVAGTGDIFDVLQNIAEIRILHNTDPSFTGSPIEAILNLDNLSVNFVDPMGVEGFTKDLVHIYPNPVADMMKITSAFDLDGYEIYNLTGQFIISGGLDSNPFVHSSYLKSGIYFIIIKSGSQNIIKKFVKM